MSSDLEICFPLQLHKRKISSLIFKQELCSWLYFSKFMSCRNTRLGFDHVMTTKFAIFNLGIQTPSLSSFEWKGESECHSRSKGDFPSLHLKKKKTLHHSSISRPQLLLASNQPKPIHCYNMINATHNNSCNNYSYHMTEQCSKNIPTSPDVLLPQKIRRLRRVSKLNMISYGLMCPYLTIHQVCNQDLAILADKLKGIHEHIHCSHIGPLCCSRRECYLIIQCAR